MAETRTPRFKQPQWSAGSDAPARGDFNEAFGNVEAWAAYDDGQTLTALPSTNLVTGRYALISFGTDGKSLYRYNGSSFDLVGGSVIPRFQRFKALEGQALTDSAWHVEHPSMPGKSIIASYGGDLTAAGLLKLWNADDDTKGSLVIGWNGALSPATTGRAYVRTRKDGELGLVLHGHGSAAGNMLTVREPGGSDMLTVDAAGRLTQRTFAAFGGAALQAAHMLAVAPTSSTSDAVTNGVLLYGQSGASGKTILQVWRDAADTAAIVNVGRDSISVGRLPWAGLLTHAADRHTFRVSGRSGNSYYWRFFRSDPTSAATEADPSKDVLVLNADSGGFGSFLPTYLVQTLRPAVTTLTVWRDTDFNGNFMDLQRRIPDGSGGYTFQNAAMWASDGKLRTGAWWRGTGTLRDARQALHHNSKKTWAASGGSQSDGVKIDRSTSYTYTWPVMTARSNGGADLSITTALEAMLSINTADGMSDAQVYGAETFIAINGGIWQSLGTNENAQTTPENVNGNRRWSGDVLVFTKRLSNLPPAATFQVRTVVSVGIANPSLYLRSLEIDVEECIIEYYTAP